ncbi:MAG: hypothetical protein J3Q66DRAFT_389113 [Benniella sp.]|nr:MAG: hypothetical protein J3Q66DRAFT_389113 [Benniella sp.]
MGKLYPSCIASNSNSIWFIANAYPTDVPAGYSHFVLVRSPPFPTDTDTDQWTIMGTVPHLELKPFIKPGSYSRSLFETTTCTVDDNGVFAIATGYDDDIMRIVRFDPKSSVAWSVLDSVSIGRPLHEFHLFLTSNTGSSSSALYFIYPQTSEQAAPLAINTSTNETEIPTTTESSSTLSPTASPTASPAAAPTDSPIPSPEQSSVKTNITPIAIRVGQTQVKGSSAFNCRTITLMNVDGAYLNGMTVGNGNLYADISQPQLPPATEIPGNSTTSQLFAYPLTSLITPGNLSAPEIYPSWYSDCGRRISATSGDLIYTICERNDYYDELLIANGTELFSLGESGSFDCFTTLWNHDDSGTTLRLSSIDVCSSQGGAQWYSVSWEKILTGHSQFCGPQVVCATVLLLV